MSFFFNRQEDALTRHKDIHVNDYRDLFINNGRDHLLLDVREREAFAEGHIPGAVNIPMDELLRRIDEIPRHKPVILVSDIGRSSVTCAEILADKGYHDLYNLVDGTFGWMIHGLPLNR